MRRDIFRILIVAALLSGCVSTSEHMEHQCDCGGHGHGEQCEQEWIGEDTPEQIEKIQAMNVAELKDFLKEHRREPGLRVEALRLVMSRLEPGEEMYSLLLSSLKAPTVREREAALYYLSGLGKREHINAIKASGEDMHECHDHSEEGCGCYKYSVECTIKQILERTKEDK